MHRVVLSKKVLKRVLIGLNVGVFGAVVVVLWILWKAPPEPVEESVEVALWQGLEAPEAAGQDGLCRDCNVLFISLDILRGDHLPCFGYARDTAPHLCDLAKNGAVFDNFVVHAYQTPISQMSIFSSQYPSSSGFVSFSSQIDPSTPYLPEVLSENGYKTMAMGSSFEVMTDMSSELVERLGRQVNVIPDKKGLNPGLSFGRGFDRFVFTGHRNLPSDALVWLEEANDEKFFLWLPIGTLHWPYGAVGSPEERRRFDPPDYNGLFSPQDQLGFRTMSRVYDGQYYPSQSPVQALSEDDVEYIRARYDYGVYYTDAFLGELFQTLHETGLAENTLVVLHGVHGEDLGEHGYFAHYDIYDTEVRVPLVVFHPGLPTKGKRITGQVQGIDLAPTLLNLLGLAEFPGAEGESLVPALRDGKVADEKPAFVERIPLWEDMFRHLRFMPPAYVDRISPILDARVYGDVAIRTNQWKLIHRRSRHIEQEVSWWTYLTDIPVKRPEYELYDLVADPLEQNDVFDERSAEVTALLEQLTAWEESTYREGLVDQADGRPR